jgi:DNA repair protein RecN (Recombination protein N)
LYKERAVEQVVALRGGKEKITSLREEVEMKLISFKAACQDLSSARMLVAERLVREIEKELLELNFKNAEFKIEISQTKYSKNGMDSVAFLIKTNAGMQIAPMVKIASGGEVSRIMLAIKSALRDYSDIDTMLFDEIDTGISGITASIVGKKLREMARTNQIIVITHLPQIAAYANEHFVIDKEEGENTTITSIRKIEGKERTLELARLISGNMITENTIKAAEELIFKSK